LTIVGKVVEPWPVSAGGRTGRLLQHGGNVTSVAFSNDGKQLATASMDASVRLWRWSDEEGNASGAVQTLKAKVALLDVAFAPDGHLLATASADGTAVVWDGSTGESLHTFDHRDKAGGGSGQPAPSKLVKSVAFNPRDDRLIVTSAGNAAWIWQMGQDDHPVRRLLHREKVNTAAYDSNGARIVTSSGYNAFVWDTTQQDAATIQLPHESDVTSAEFSPDGTRVLTATDEGAAYVWSLTDVRTPPTKLLGHGYEVTAEEPLRALVEGSRKGLTQAHFSQDGKLIVTSGNDGTVRIWDADPVREPGESHLSGAVAAMFDTSGTHVVAATKRFLTLLDLETKDRLDLPGPGGYAHLGEITSVSVSPHGDRAITGGADERALLWDTDAGKSIREVPMHGSRIAATAFSCNGDRAAVAAGGVVKLLAAADGAEADFAIAPGRDVIALAFRCDRDALVTVSGRGPQTWEVPSGHAVAAAAEDGPAATIAAFDCGATRVVTASGSTVEAWNTATARPIGAPIDMGCEVKDVAISCNGETAAAVGRRCARIWNVETGTRLGLSASWRAGPRALAAVIPWTSREPELPRLDLANAALSSDGVLLATATTDGGVDTWEVSSGQHAGSVEKASRPLRSLAFSLDRSRLITANESGDVRVYPRQAFAPVKELLDEWLPKRLTRTVSMGEARRTEP
jgi:WD40 repeat protein